MKDKILKLIEWRIILTIIIVIVVAIVISAIMLQSSEKVSPIDYPIWITRKNWTSTDFTASNSQRLEIQATKNFANKAFDFFKKNPYFKSYPSLDNQKIVDIYTTGQGIENANKFCSVAINYYNRIINDMKGATQNNIIASVAIQVNIKTYTDSLESSYSNNQVNMLLNATYPGYENGGIQPPPFEKLLSRVAKAKSQIIFATELTTALDPTSYTINMKDLISQKRV